MRVDNDKRELVPEEHFILPRQELQETFGVTTEIHQEARQANVRLGYFSSNLCFCIDLFSIRRVFLVVTLLGFLTKTVTTFSTQNSPDVLKQTVAEVE